MWKQESVVNGYLVATSLQSNRWTGKLKAKSIFAFWLIRLSQCASEYKMQNMNQVEFAVYLCGGMQKQAYWHTLFVSIYLTCGLPIKTVACSCNDWFSLIYLNWLNGTPNDWKMQFVMLSVCWFLTYNLRVYFCCQVAFELMCMDVDSSQWKLWHWKCRSCEKLTP